MIKDILRKKWKSYFFGVANKPENIAWLVIAAVAVFALGLIVGV